MKYWQARIIEIGWFFFFWPIIVLATTAVVVVISASVAVAFMTAPSGHIVFLRTNVNFTTTQSFVFLGITFGLVGILGYLVFNRTSFADINRRYWDWKMLHSPVLLFNDQNGKGLLVREEDKANAKAIQAGSKTLYLCPNSMTFSNNSSHIYRTGKIADRWALIKKYRCRLVHDATLLVPLSSNVDKGMNSEEMCVTSMRKARKLLRNVLV